MNKIKTILKFIKTFLEKNIYEIVYMGFLRAEVDYKETKFVAKMYYSWLYLGEQIIEKSFDSLEEAKEWLLQERCYNKLQITDKVETAQTYRDALTLQLNNKKYHNNDNKKKH